MKLRRVGAGGVRETLTVPNHAQRETGTCRAIPRQASRYVRAEELTPFFYGE